MQAETEVAPVSGSTEITTYLEFRWVDSKTLNRPGVRFTVKDVYNRRCLVEFLPGKVDRPEFLDMGSHRARLNVHPNRSGSVKVELYIDQGLMLDYVGAVFFDVKDMK